VDRHADIAHGEEPKPRIFISYSRRDMSFADCLEVMLKMSGFRASDRQR
jgi:hypothetical protein